MAIGGLLGALKIIPWSEVVAAAPTVVRGAQQLWQKVRHEAPAEAPPAPPPGAAGRDEALAALAARLHAAESRLAAQAAEAEAASGLIAALAEQNARLIEAVEQLRRRARLLGIAAGVLGAGVVVALVGAFGR